MAPPEQARRSIGFRVEEARPRYRVRAPLLFSASPSPPVGEKAGLRGKHGGCTAHHRGNGGLAGRGFGLGRESECQSGQQRFPSCWCCLPDDRDDAGLCNRAITTNELRLTGKGFRDEEAIMHFGNLDQGVQAECGG